MTNRDKILAELQKRRGTPPAPKPPKPDVPRYLNGQPEDPGLYKHYLSEKRLAAACGGVLDMRFIRNVLMKDASFNREYAADLQLMLEADRADETAAAMEKAAANFTDAPGLAAGEKNNAIDAQIED